MAFQNVDQLPLGKLLQPSQKPRPSKLGKRRRKKLLSKVKKPD